MLKSYITIALRNIARHKFYSALNISGLALGLTASFLIGLYIYDELTFDQFHADYHKIYHIGMDIDFGGQDFKTASSCPPLAQAMIDNIPGVEAAVRINPWPLKDLVVRCQERAFTEHNAFYADSNFFSFFSFKLLEGDKQTVLKEPHSIVLTQALATKYFGKDAAVGKTLTVGNNNDAYLVTGIAETPPANSHIQFEMLLSSVSDHGMTDGGWGDNDGLYTYIKINPQAELSAVSDKLREMVKVNVAPELEDALGTTFAEFEKKGGIYAFFPYALADSHLYYPEITDGPTAGSSDIRYLYMIGAVGIFILTIACINFMNLSTARATRRAREVGLRKTFGSAYSKLILQFFSESFVYVLVGTLVAVLGVYLLLPSFNSLTGKELSFGVILTPDIVICIVAIFIIVSLLAGSYPAFYLTSFKPLDILKGRITSGVKSKRTRHVLVVLQFSMSIALIICTAIVYGQLNFMRDKDIGLDKQNVLVLQIAGRLKHNQDGFMEAVRAQSQVVGASFNNNGFPEINRAAVFRSMGDKRDYLFHMYSTDYDHLDVLKIELVRGRYFSEAIASDSMGVVINESAVRELGWNDPLQGKLTFDLTSPEMPVIGVVKDFNFESFKSKVRPLVILLRKRSDFMHIRYRGNAASAIASIEQLWKQYAQGSPFEYTFLDENFDVLFREEQRLGRLFIVMSGIAIFVACLGLLGLAAYTAEQRTREIGIRKVLGASVTSINAMLSREFMILVGISFIIASSGAWYIMDQWLHGFAFRIALNPFVFLLSGLLATIIAWLTVCYHFTKAARTNPCDAIRWE